MARWSRVDAFEGNRVATELVAHRPCPVCSADAPEPVLELPGFQYHLDSAEVPKRIDLRVVRCGGCDAMYQDPCLTSAGYDAVMTEAEASFGASAGRADEEAAWLLERGLAGAALRVLDVGCHDGALLARLPGERIGVDADERALARARATHEGIRFVHGAFETFALDGTVDTFTMFHVLEHLPRPVGALRRLAALAAPGARLVVEVPIAEHGATNDVCGFFSVFHTSHFTRDSLRRTLEAAGWHVHEWEEQPDYNGCRVVAATVPGAADSPAGDPAAADRCLDAWRRAAAGADAELARVSGAPRLLIWGGGTHTEMLYHATSFFRTAPDREYAIVDRDPAKAGGSWRGVPIVPPEALAGLDDGVAPLLASSYQGQPDIAAEAARRGIAPERIVALYDRISVH